MLKNITDVMTDLPCQNCHSWMPQNH